MPAAQYLALPLMPFMALVPRSRASFINIKIGLDQGSYMRAQGFDFMGGFIFTMATPAMRRQHA